MSETATASAGNDRRRWLILIVGLIAMTGALLTAMREDLGETAIADNSAMEEYASKFIEKAQAEGANPENDPAGPDAAHPPPGPDVDHSVIVARRAE